MTAPPVLIGHASHNKTDVAIDIATASFLELSPVFILFLASGRHSPNIILRHIERLFPGVPVVGGSVAGTITYSEVSYAGFGISVLAFVDPLVAPFFLCSMLGVDSDFERAYALGTDIAARTSAGQSAIILYDTVAASDPFRLHHGSSIAAGLELGVGDRDLHFVGAGLLTSPNFDDSWLCAGTVLKHAIVAVIFPSPVSLETTILPGSRSTGIALQITAIEGADVIELDGRPAYEVICEVLGRDSNPAHNLLAFNVSLGEPQLPSASAKHLGRTRLILRQNKELGTVTLFEPDFRPGDRVHLFLQDSDYMLREARRLTALHREASNASEVLFSIYLDCAGRSSALTGSLEEEARVVMAGLPSHWPKIGGYTGVEIARVESGYRALDLTGILAVFRMR